MWVQVDQMRARQSPWFGVKGTLKAVLWLMLVLALIELVRSGILLIEIVGKGVTGAPLLVAFAILLLAKVILCGWLLHVVLNGLAGVRSFARWAPWVLGAIILLICATFALPAFQLQADAFDRLLRSALPVLLVSLAIPAALIAYVRLSRQVNATYRWRLRSAEAAQEVAA